MAKMCHGLKKREKNVASVHPATVFQQWVFRCDAHASQPGFCLFLPSASDGKVSDGKSPKTTALWDGAAVTPPCQLWALFSGVDGNCDRIGGVVVERGGTIVNSHHSTLSLVGLCLTARSAAPLPVVTSHPRLHSLPLKFSTQDKFLPPPNNRLPSGVAWARTTAGGNKWPVEAF